MKLIRAIIIGCGAVGKTSLLIRYNYKTFPYEYIPNNCNEYYSNTCYNGIDLGVWIWDSAGEEVHQRLRTLLYQQTNVFILCYSISNRESYELVNRYWKEELDQCAKDVPIILVGTKCDLGKDFDYERSWYGKNNPQREVSMKEGIEMSLKIKASYFIEVSAKTGENVEELFEKVFQIGLRDELVCMRNNKKEKCVIC